MPITFRQFMGRLGDAAMYAQSIAAAAGSQRWKDKCDTEVNKAGETIYTPKLLKVQLPNGPLVEIPELGIDFPTQMPMEQLGIKFTAMVDMTSDSDMFSASSDSPTDNLPHITMSPKRGLFSKATEFEVETIFKLQPPTEIQECLRDSMAQTIKNQM